MLRLLIIAILTLAFLPLSARTQYETEFYTHVQNPKELKLAEADLNSWRNADPADPELSLAEFAYHVEKARKVSMSKPDRYGRRTAVQSWNRKELAKAIDCIDRGIAAHPDRLDFYLTKAENAMLTEDYASAGNTLAALLTHGRSNSYRWTIAHGLSVSDSVNATRSSIQPFLRQLFDVHTAESMAAMKQLATEAEKDFPKDAGIIDALGKLALMENDTELAVKLFGQATELNGTNAEYLLDLAYACFLSGQDARGLDCSGRVLKMEGVNSGLRTLATNMSHMAATEARPLTLQQFEFTVLPRLAWNFSPGASDLFLSNADFILNKYMLKIGYKLDFNTKGITAELVNVDGTVCVCWTFPTPKELGMMGYLVMVPNGPRFDVFALVSYDRDRVMGEHRDHRDYWEVYLIEEKGMTAYAKFPRPQKVAGFAREVVSGVLR